MGLKINGIGSIFAPFFKGEGREIQEDISVQEAAGGRDSYVSSAVGEEQMYTSGNYDQQGEMTIFRLSCRRRMRISGRRRSIVRNTR